MIPEATIAGGPLTPEHRQQLALAQQRAKSIRRAAAVAAFNGGTLAVLIALSAPFALFSFTDLLAVVALAVVAYNELRGRKRLLAFDPSAATLLGWNQVGLLGLIVLYCLWMLYSSLTGPNAVAEELKAFAEVAEALPGAESLARTVVIALYGMVILLSVVFQGLNALYYFSRRSHIESYRRETPAWIVELQRLPS